MEKGRVCTSDGMREHFRSEGAGVLQLAIQPGLEVRSGESVLAAAVVGPLTGNSCPGDGSTPFVGCPAGIFCPTPAQRLLCPAVSKLHCEAPKPTDFYAPPEVLHQTLGPLTR